MDKNMIHIDDLVRQRLRGGEEEERPGAWLNMRDLLDQKMPVQTAPGGITNWRRLLGYTAGLLLLASLSVGGYEITTGMRGHSKGGVEKAATTVSRVHGQSPASAATTTATPQPVATDNAVKDEPVNGSAIAAKTEGGTAPADHHGHNAKITHTATSGISTASTNNSHTNPEQSQDAIVAANTDNKTAGPVADDMATGTPDNRISQETVSIKNNKTQHHQHTSLPKHRTATAPLAVNNQKAIFNSSLGTASKKDTHNNLATVKTPVPATTNNGIAVSSHKKHKHSMKPLISTGGNATSVATVQSAKHAQNAAKMNIMPASNAKVSTAGINNLAVGSIKAHTKSPETTIDKLVIVERMSINPLRQVSSVSFDTISMSKINIDDMNAVAFAQVGKGLPGGSEQKAANKNDNNDEGGSKSKLHKSSGSGMTAMEKFNQMIENFKYNFGHMEFTPGIIGGINATFFGPYSLKGFQFGVTGNWKMDEHWSFLTELKYMNRTSNNAVIHDNYIRYNTSTAGRDSVQRYFNLSNLQSVELPIAVNYKYGRLNIFAGGSVMYNFAINATFAENPYALPDANGPVTAPRLSINDFAARLGLSYMVGAAYQITPSLQLDLRMSRMFWDNGNGSGSQIISNDLYNTPSFQLSIGYRFKQDKKLP